MRYNTNNSHDGVLEPQTKPFDAEQLLQEINYEEVLSLMPLIVFYSAILIVGVVGNFLVLLVYTFRYKRSPARVFILFLASIDFSICLFGLPYHLIDLTHPYTFTSRITCKLLTFVITTLFHMSVFGLIVIAIDRYLNICKPLSHLHISFFKKRRACFCAAVAAVLFSWPNLVLYGPSEMESPNANLTGYACYFESQYLDTNYPLVYTLSMLFVCVSSTIFLIVVYSLIYIEIYKSYTGFARAKTIQMKYDDVSQTDEVSLKSIVKPKPVSSSRVHFITKFERSSKKKTFQSDPRQYGQINMIYNPKGKNGLNNNQNSEVRKALMENEDDNNIINTVLRKNSRHTQNDDEEYHVCICHEKHKMQNSNLSNNQIVECSNENNSDDDSKFITNRDNFKDCSNCEENEQMLDNRDQCTIHRSIRAEINFGSNRSVNSTLKPKRLLDLYASNSTESVVKSTGSLDSKKPKHGGFPMCRPQRIKRRSLGHVGINASLDDGCQRSVSLGNINGVHLEPGIRLKSSSSSSVCKSLNNRRPKTTKAKHSKITKIMLTITIVFLLSYAPALIVTILSVIKPDIWDIMTVHETILCEFFLRFYLVNNVCNPFIYGFWDKRFLREIETSFKKLSQRIRDLFCCFRSD